ncbi:hypothetical protein SLS64_011312 [Diaporthe eres]
MEGPKLEPFRGTASADIRFERFLGSSQDLDSKVFRVSIDGRTYALKIQEGREDLAVRAYGYVPLTQAQERQVTVALGEEYIDWEKSLKPLDCSGIFTRFEAHRHARVRAIVKELVPSTEPWTAPQIPQIYADLEELHALGILVRDMHQGNYLGGKLINFSQAWIMYHPCLDRATPRGVKLRRQSEPQKFEEMIDVWAASEKVNIKKPAGLLMWHSGLESDFGIDPREYP